ncbi:class F sortase [Microbacterium sp. 1.5R]|uniref:class F sortase n=1 Tax=Microbacterium sp. 1.5R TaxID=1916917 RepID=UPI0011A02380|nr:class F sortase [Microbacterium sp. 1.5R]
MVSAALLVACAGQPVAVAPEQSSPPAASAAPSSAPPPTESPADAGAISGPVGVEPARVSIPRIDLDEPLIDLGLTADATMEVPADFDAVGWFTGGGRPGGHGPVVIAGHVDSPTGAAVFFRLRELVPDDLVDVTDADGIRHTYRVVEVADYAKADFPTVRVFGAVADDELRLITCGGVFDQSAGSYEDNRVVFAVRA